MHTENGMTTDSRIFDRQLTHLVLLGVLLIGLWLAGRLPEFWNGEFLGLSTGVWVYLTVADTVLHQAFVWFCWRSELYGQYLTKKLGQSAFASYATGFAILGLARPVLLTCLAISNAGTLPMDPVLSGALSVMLAVPSIYTFYSVHRYFTFTRAVGMDHFDPSYRSLPMVTQGIFRFTGNAMYTFGFLLLWIPGVALRSTGAVAVVLFSHLYIWVHYYVTEKPDMDFIYGPRDGQA